MQRFRPFFNSSSSVDEVSPEDNGNYVDYGDDCVPYGEEYDGNLHSNGLDEEDMYHTETTGNDDLNYEKEFSNIETNYEQEIAPNEVDDTLPQPESETQDRTIAPKKNFFGSATSSVKSKTNRSSFFGKSQNAAAAPRAPTPPFSYISSDSSCGSTDSLVLSGESAEESHSAAASSGIALTTTQTAATEDTNHTPVRGTSDLQDSTIPPPEAAQHAYKVAKQLFSSPAAAVKPSGGTSRPKPTTAAPAKSVAPASAPAAARISTAPFPFLSSAPPKFSASTLPAPSFGSFSSASFTPSFGASTNKMTFATTTAATAGNTRPPLFSAPSQQQGAAKPKQKVKTKAKSVTFQTGTKTAKEPSATPVTPMSSADAALSVEQAICADRCAEGQSSPTDTAPASTSFVPVTPAPHSSNMVTISDRAVLHQVTPDANTSISHQQRKQNADTSDEVCPPNTEYGDRDGIVSPLASRASRTVSTEEDYDSSGYYSAVRAVEPTTLSSPAVYDSGTILSLTMDTAQALSLCEQQMDPQAEELRDRLRSARDTVRECRTAMVQHIHSTARTHTQYLVEDSVGSAAPKLMELQRKMEQLRMRYKAIETAREQLCVPMEVE